ncbi:hypothetical protein Tco_0683070 [Tanacetum coccineum]|uniref:Uncharacterized protein n=1 Tax=Tanacetum coccineum TaxID=301880 RepID=A0ABQ4XSY2_9ASTR
MMSFLTAVVTSRVMTTTYAAGKTTRKYTTWCKWKHTRENNGLLFGYNGKGVGVILPKQLHYSLRGKDENMDFNDKVLLVQAQAGGQALTEEEMAFLADPGLPDIQTPLRHLRFALMAYLSRNGSDALTESEIDLKPSDSNIIPYSPVSEETQQEILLRILTSFAQQDVLILLSKKEPLPQLSLRARGGLNIQRLVFEMKSFRL